MWEYSGPLISPEKRVSEPSLAQKDPSIVYDKGRWHIFMTVKLPGRTVMEYCSFTSWLDANKAQRTVLNISDSKYACAPQVFYFRPQKKWYLVYQVGMPGAKMMWVAYSTSNNIADPTSWSKASPILDGGATDPRKEGGLDYWIICDQKKAYLFYTNLNGKLWRGCTDLKDFPAGFDHFELALQGPFFEASHTYRLAGMQKYLTIIEENGKRYYKAYLADTLDGVWSPLAVTADHPFAGSANIRPAAGVTVWTDNVSHVELIRKGSDEMMTVDGANLQMVFQGMMDKDKGGIAYGQFQWRLGLLTPVKASVGREY